MAKDIVAEPTVKERLLIEIERDMFMTRCEDSYIPLEDIAKAIVAGLGTDAKYLNIEIRKIIETKYESDTSHSN